MVINDSYNKIGGLGNHVEIDKSKFRKRKYSHGHIIEGQWVLGGICRETKEMFLVTIPSHDEQTLLPIIKDRIKPGTTTAGKAMIVLKKNKGFLHLTANHSLNFVDPGTGCHTQNIESCGGK